MMKTAHDTWQRPAADRVFHWARTINLVPIKPVAIPAARRCTLSAKFEMLPDEERTRVRIIAPFVCHKPKRIEPVMISCRVWAR